MKPASSQQAAKIRFLKAQKTRPYGSHKDSNRARWDPELLQRDIYSIAWHGGIFWKLFLCVQTVEEYDDVYP